MNSDIRRLLDSIRLRALKAAGDGLEEGGELIAMRARDNLTKNGSVFTGNLRKSIHVERMGDTVIKVSASAKGRNGYNYAARIEWSPKVNKPYLWPALNQSRNEVKEIIAESLEREFER